MTENPTFYGHVFLFLTTVAGFVYSWFREGRRYRWQREEFESMRREIKANGKTHE